MPQCAVATCRNSHRKTKGRRVRYHRFPAEDDVRIRWVSVCGRGAGGGTSASFNPSTARVCSLHFSPNSYERDVEHELLGLTPRSRLRKGAVPDRSVPIPLPSLINKRRPPRQRQQQQQVTKGGKKRANQRREPYQDYEDEEEYPRVDPNGYDVLLALGLMPSKTRRENDCRHDLNRMHVMEEDGGNKTSPGVAAEPKTNGASETGEDSVEHKEDDVEIKENGDKGESDEMEEEEVETADEKVDVETVDEDDSVKSSEEKSEVEPPAELQAKDVEQEKDVDAAKEGSVEENAEGDKMDDLKVEESLPPSPVDGVEEDSGGSMNGDKGSEDRKRECSDSDSDTPSVVKKMKMTHAEYDERERSVNEYVESAAGASLEEIQRCAEKIQQEVDTLSAMARAKEHEWNNIIRLKKVKEEMFLRLQRKKQVMMIMMGTPGWELSYGECSGGNDEVRVKQESSTRSSKRSGKTNSQHPTSSGISLLKNNQHPHSLMMVPIVSSSPGNFPSAHNSLSSASSLRVPDMANRDRNASRTHRPILPKPPASATVNGGNGNSNGQNPVIGEGRQGPILDVRSIIADYRSRHPETVPRRGRRLKSSLSPTPNSHLPENLVSSTRVSGGGGILSMANLALGSGSQMRAGIVGSTSVEMGDLGLLLSAVGEAARQESSRPSSADSSRSGAPSQNTGETGNTRSNISFKDVLVQFAKMSQTEQRLDHLPPANQPSKPPPYPDVTLHPVLSPPSPPHQSPSSSLLHGILTKSSNMHHQQRMETNNRPATFSPTLARLLTAPERVPANNPHSVQSNHPHFRPSTGQVSISDLLSTSKQTRNEITITPVTSQPIKAKQDVVIVEEEQEDSVDRLVIDESADQDNVGGRETTDEDQVQDILAEDVPECQGCHQRTAQFVCAGCGNQWYCSRDCQVTAWDEHSDVCSG